jgi:hypothetical protein
MDIETCILWTYLHLNINYFDWVGSAILDLGHELMLKVIN